ncbi:MAG: gamma-glutamyltransferase [Geodermatophilaceae bacterium]|nr:gamma-glutamyltransferase [Geodermatophilaceae bacterium]
MFTTRPELSGTFGMVASTHWLASAAGMAILEEGGTAVDAAVATGLTLQVVEPHLNGPGGEVPILFASPGVAPMVLCGQGVAPAAAAIEHYRDQGLDSIPGTGLLAATVPGAIGAWLTFLRDHGTFPLNRVLRFAIDYAANGHPLLPRVAATVAASADTFASHWPTSAQLWLDGQGRPPTPNVLWRNQTLAATYQRLLDAAHSAGRTREQQVDGALTAWHEGFVAEAIERHARTPVMDESGTRHAGVLTAQDLAGWRPAYEPPVSLDWHGHTVCKAGPWSQGPSFLMALGILDNLPDAGAPYASAAQIHAATEAVKLAMADREAWLGDALPAPIEALLSAEYARERAALVGDKAATGLRPGSPGGAEPRLADYVVESADAQRRDSGMAGVGEPTVARTPGDTCHLDVVDRHGTIVSATPSGGWLQSSPTIAELGFALGTRAQMFWLQPGLASSLLPGTRPRTTLTPTLVMRGDQPTIGFGTPGGDQQEQWQLTFWLAHSLGGLNLQEAIDAPSWHTTAFPSSFAPRTMPEPELLVEERVGDEVIADLERRGHTVVRSGPWSLGRMSAVSRDPDTGVVRAGANPRGMQGYATGR